MNKLFLKIATRYLLKNKLYSFINIFGLAIGVASFIFIMLYVNYERSYDRFEGSENVYRVYMDYLEGDEWVPGDANAYIVSAPTLKDEFPEIIDFARLRQVRDILLLQQNAIFDHLKGSLTDPSFLQIFDYSLSQGDASTALNEPYSIVLTEALAAKMFGKENPLGKALKIFDSNSPNFTVTGVLKDDNRNTHIKNDFLVSFKTFYTWDVFERDWKYTWNQNMYFTYIQVDPMANAVQLQNKIKNFKVDGLLHERHNIEPLEDIHLYSDKPYEAEANGSASRITFLMAIALIIIILSWLNYINLSTAKSLERAKETGIRKVAGALKPQIIWQSVLESMLLNIVSVIIAFLVVLALLPLFNSYIGKDLSIHLSSLKGILPMLGFVLFGSLLSGLYPAFVLSKYSPAKALKGKIQTSGNGLIVRKVLIMGQFLATIVLLIGTIIVTKQIKFLGNQPIGADLNQVVALNGQVLNSIPDSLFTNKLETFKKELVKFPFVEITSQAETYPGDGYDELNSNSGITFPDGTRDDKRITYNYAVDQNYFELMDIEFIAGGPFRQNSEGNSTDIVMNEKFVRFMGISNMEDAIDKTVEFFGRDNTIVGVIKDYHHFGLKTSIEPMILRYDKQGSNLLVKFNEEASSVSGMTGAIGQIQEKWTGQFPQSTFNYTFLDQKFEAQYKEDKAFGSAFQVFTILAILIASMGLFGLTSYTVIQRRKEIGIRKVNGATIIQILSLLNKDFVKWVGLAFIIAVPISWYAMHRWLEGFAYKTTMSWWVFGLAGILALIIALLTVSWQSFRAAVANPVEALRNE
ncbi:ABC transporter permease [Maribacter sp. PR1]|uniref:ABC transporter permease n=1 Tax=Maribacter cobaltidurans TaxID=1178778 RepID=A0ABU7IRM4_9FLAO|nr:MULTISPECIES: ABC transporter permease [Maribacter]MDC6388231.1 ABC transporter permease [Maribacter sp. PR1]MEE1975619.1 ABC transporter permease [Maribacter cobaltidurans]